MNVLFYHNVHYWWLHQDQAVGTRLVLVFQVLTSDAEEKKKEKEEAKRSVFRQLQVRGDRLGEYLLLGLPSR